MEDFENEGFINEGEILENGNDNIIFQFHAENGNDANGHLNFPVHNQQHYANGNGYVALNDADGDENEEEVPEAVNEEEEESEEDGLAADLPAWALALPDNGYIKHPDVGYIMHPSFYDNRHLLNLDTDSHCIYDGEVDGSLCPYGQICNHIKNCFEVRVRMAVWANLRFGISFRDAECIWGVSRSTISRRKRDLVKRNPMIFLLTPQH